MLDDDQLTRARFTGLTPPEAQRKRDLKRWRKRRHVARRVSQRERHALGLPAHVGVSDFDRERAAYYAALERMIAREIRDGEARLRPLAQIGFDGRTPVLRTEDVQLRDAAGELVVQTAVRNTTATPLDYLAFQAKTRIEKWEWLAGKRFEYDWHLAQHGKALTMSLADLEMAKTYKKSRDTKREDRLRPPTFMPRRPKRQRMGPMPMADARLDAMARLGRLMDEVSRVGFFLLEHVIGHERWLKDVAASLGEPVEYVGRRFREALDEAAAHYRLAPASRPRNRGR